MMRKIILGLFFFFLFLTESYAQDTTYLKVHFLYGSTPKKEFKESESKWFGGKIGGHVGIEFDSNKIINFIPHGEFHWCAKEGDHHSKFAIHSIEGFYEIFGSPSEEVKKTWITIPITKQQKQKLDSIVHAYTRQTPYDYAFVGMRCGAAAYEILGQLGILKKISYRKTYLKIFYPKKLRKRILKKAEKNNWTVVREEGSDRRNWKVK